MPADDELVEAVRAGAARSTTRAAHPARPEPTTRRYPALRTLIRVNRALTWGVVAYNLLALTAGLIALRNDAHISLALTILVLMVGFAVIAFIAIVQLALGDLLQVGIDIERNTRRIAVEDDDDRE